jgi:structural maintenance of chromosome 3 (chondroitin sulfate proteoglycan 6)
LTHSTLQEKSLDNIRNQIEQIQSSIAMKKDEMGTELIDQLTHEERDLLSRLNPEITDFKDKFQLCKNARIEVVETNSVIMLGFSKHRLSALSDC